MQFNNQPWMDRFHIGTMDGYPSNQPLVQATIKPQVKCNKRQVALLVAGAMWCADDDEVSEGDDKNHRSPLVWSL
jgi:hypothetical protein